MLYWQWMTQWVSGFAGPYALNMQVFFHELDRKKLPEELYDDYLEKLVVIEHAALKHINKR